MRQEQNHQRLPIISLGFILLFSSGCGSLFKRSDEAPVVIETPTSQLQKENEAKQTRIRELETSVGTLHGRINELETKLRAAESKPQALSTNSLDSSKKTSNHTNHDELPQDFVARSYQQAKILMNLEKYPEAVLAFSALTEKYSKHPLASHAQYGLATAYYKQGEFAIAAQEYESLIKSYPVSARVAEAYLKLADCYEKTGKAPEAEKALIQVKANYPDFYPQSEKPKTTKLIEKSIKTPVPPQVEIPTAPQVAVEGEMKAEASSNTGATSNALDEPPVGSSATYEEMDP